MLNKTTLVKAVLAFACASASANAQDAWIPADGIVANPDTAAYSNDINTLWVMGFIDMGQKDASLANVVNNLKNRSDSGSWKVYYNNLDATTSIFKDDGKSGILMYAGDETGNSVYSNAYTKLILSDEVLAASRAKISFNLGYVGNSEGTSLTITINGPGWTVVEITPELRGMALDAYVPEAQFSFGLVNLSTNEIYGANVSTDSGTYFLSDDIADWFTFNAGEDGVVTVSFDLDADQLSRVTEAGLGLLVQSRKTGKFEIYEIGDFSVEYIAVPEPATVAALLGLLGLAFALCSRRK